MPDRNYFIENLPECHEFYESDSENQFVYDIQTPTEYIRPAFVCMALTVLIKLLFWSKLPYFTPGGIGNKGYPTKELIIVVAISYLIGMIYTKVICKEAYLIDLEEKKVSFIKQIFKSTGIHFIFHFDEVKEIKVSGLNDDNSSCWIYLNDDRSFRGSDPCTSHEKTLKTKVILETLFKGNNQDTRIDNPA